MCGRYAITTDAQSIIDYFRIEHVLFNPDEFRPRYNIAPSQPVPAVRQGGKGRELTLLRWGLIPFWAKDPKIGYRMINARAETAAEKPAYRAAFRHRRCLLPATGFYEWKGERGHKQPYHIAPPDGGLFAFAGLWEHWEGEGGAVESCTILVTEANDEVRPIHDRMPVILGPDRCDDWLDTGNGNVDQLRSMLRPYGGALMTYPVSKLVNKPENDDPRCIEPAAAP